MVVGGQKPFSKTYQVYATLKTMKMILKEWKEQGSREDLGWEQEEFGVH